MPGGGVGVGAQQWEGLEATPSPRTVCSLGCMAHPDGHWPRCAAFWEQQGTRPGLHLHEKYIDLEANSSVDDLSLLFRF